MREKCFTFEAEANIADVGDPFQVVWNYIKVDEKSWEQNRGDRGDRSKENSRFHAHSSSNQKPQWLSDERSENANQDKHPHSLGFLEIEIDI